MATELIINASLPETRIALMEDGEIQDLLIERASDKGITGNIYKGRVTRVLPGMQAAFVDIGLEKAAFLYVDDVFVHSNNPVTEETEDQKVWDGVEDEADLEPADLEAADNDAGEPPADDAALEGVSADSESPESDDASFEGVDTVADEDDEEGGEPVAMSAEDNDEKPAGTVTPQDEDDDSQARFLKKMNSTREAAPEGEASVVESASGNEGAVESVSVQPAGEEKSEGERDSRGRPRRGKRGGRGRDRERDREPRGDRPEKVAKIKIGVSSNVPGAEGVPSVAQETLISDEAQYEGQGLPVSHDGSSVESAEALTHTLRSTTHPKGKDEAFRAPRTRDRRIKPRSSMRPVRANVGIGDLLKEGQEVLVQVAKDPIATKGARLTCHISLPGRHLVCMPTIDHVGVSRRIERDDERRKLREIVERNRPKKLGFIVRTASSKSDAEKRIKQDVDYLSNLWEEIRTKAAEVSAPALVYEDLNPVLRAIRDWVNEDIDKIIVDSRYHYNEMQKFVSSFMPSLGHKVELYQGDIPVFDAYSISSEISRALDRRVWLKSGGYIVIDQTEALVSIDVNTGRFVGKKNLEDTIVKTNLEAVHEIAYQLRLRNCGGMIILDLIDMEKEENRHRIYRALEEALKKDRSRPTIQKISDLGLIEMTRKRTRDTMVRALCESCSHCEGKGFIKSKKTVAYEILRELERVGLERDVKKIMIQSHPEVIDILAIDERETLDQLERKYRKTIYLQAVLDFHVEQFEVAGDKAEHADAGNTYKLGSQDRDRNRSRSGSGGGGRFSNRNERDKGRGPKREERAPQKSEDEISDEPQSGDSQEPQVAQPPRPAPIKITVNPEAVAAAAALQAERAAERAAQRAAQQAAQQDSQGNVQQGDDPGNDDDSFEPGNSIAPQRAAPSADDFENEEDRLAFLRAQAAQDAAIAQLSAGGGPLRNQQQKRNGGQGGGQGGGGNWGRNNRGGQGGGQGGQGGGRNNRGGRNAGRDGGRGGRFSSNRGPQKFRPQPGGGPVVSTGAPSVKPAISTAPAGGGSSGGDEGGGGSSET